MKIFWIEAAAACLLFTGLVVPMVLKNPMNWVSDYPPAIGRRCRELGLIPEKQKSLTVPELLRKTLGCVLAVVIFSLLLHYVNGAESFRQGFFLSCGLWLVVDWYDALILDCLWLPNCRKARIPGTEDLEEAYRDYGFHIRMSAIGMVLGLPVCLLTGFGVQWLSGL